MITETVQLILYPQVRYTVEWSQPGNITANGAGFSRATIRHDPFTPRMNYILGAVAGQSVGGAPLKATLWSFTVKGWAALLPLVVKGP